MIRQSGVNPAGMAIDPQPVTTPTTEPEGRWRGWEVIQSGASAFVRSLHPFYDPLNSQLPVQDVADSAVGIDLWGVVGQTNNFQQFTALAGRAIAAYSGLPSEINSLLSYLANLAVVGRFASDQLNAFNACGGSIPEPGTHRKNTPDETLENTKDKTRKASQKHDKSATATLRAGQLPNTPLALGALVGLSAVGAAAPSSPDTDSWIDVPNAEKLGEICHHDVKSCGKKYRLTNNIDGSRLSQSIGSENNPFTGELYGNGHTIGNFSKCLVKKLQGRIVNLALSDANINSTDSAGAVACQMLGSATISNIHVERAYLETRGEKAYAGIVVGRATGGTVTNTNAENCNVTTSGEKAHAGIVVGEANGGTVTKTTAVNCRVTTSGNYAGAGIGAGSSSNSNVTDTKAKNCRVETSGNYANAGIGAGLSSNSNVTDTTAVNCTVSTREDFADAGIGAGSSTKSTVTDTTAVNCTVSTREDFAHAGIGAGSSTNSTVTDTTAVECTVLTMEDDANAGIGAGSSSYS
ncbi:ZmpA/ZmpB/ZmpC family metallo-endopeptidase-related protein, partial [Endozoicomonas sp. YOMI1]|uniref:ZmpA/ZmpB/ZmpC family metallo-endopeptidase-related protein n=1 Tax=Endozoicomonas sp. YOMI1 TaxID=2828739 RepID=UPI002149346D